MKNKLLPVLLLMGALQQPAAAFGPAAHAYIATQLFDGANPTALFAAALPDFNGAFKSSAAAENYMKRATHYEFDVLEPAPFSAAFATHNNVWGADAIAHAYFIADAPDNYVTKKLRELSERSGITMHQAEDLFDAALDIVIARDVGPSLGQQLYASAEASGSREEEILVKAYAAPLAEAADMKLDEAVLQIRWAFRCMKSAMMAYANLIQKDTALLRPIATYGSARFFGWSTTEAMAHLNIALEIAQDWQSALDTYTMELRRHMQQVPSYAPYILAGADTP